MPAIVQRSRVVRKEIRRPEKLNNELTLKSFYEKRNKVLIIRGCGGLGDIYMHRMIFEDFKRLNPDVEIHFACPTFYHEALSDHPYIDKILDCDKVDRLDYIISYSTSTACGRYEMQLAPYSDKHRSDIWANHCGVELTKHNMHFNLSDDEKKHGKELIEDMRDRSGPSVVLCPVSAMHNKNLTDEQIKELVQALRDKNCYVLGLHNKPILPLLEADVPIIHNAKIRSSMSVINQADYVLSVDTAHFHCAGGMKKPVVGIFTFVNAQIYSKYYPTAITLQGNCPAGHSGCYNWGVCPITEDNPKPCLTSIQVKDIMEKVDLMMKKWPIQRDK